MKRASLQFKPLVILRLFAVISISNVPSVAWKASLPSSWRMRPAVSQACSRPNGPLITSIWSSSTQDYSIGENVEEESTAATLRSITFCNIPKDQEPDVLADFLLELGACSAAVTDADAGTDLEQPLFGEPGATPWQDSLHWAAPVWNRCNVTAHFGAAADLEWIVSTVQESFPEQFPSVTDVTAIPHRDWVVHVQSSWKPIVVGDKFVLRFPWHTSVDVEHALAKAKGTHDKDVVELFLQGGIAFGTGEHPTTQLCLQWLDRTLPNDDASSSKPIRVLDYGSGSGVLGLAACRLGSGSVTAVGVDIDVDACRIANQNAILNNNSPMRNYLPPLWLETADEASKALWLQAHAQVHATRGSRGDEDSTAEDSILWPEDEPSDNFDVCVANILAGPLITLAPTLHSMMRPGAPIGMSGILAAQGDDVVQAFTEAGFADLQVAEELDGWVLVTGRKM